MAQLTREIAPPANVKITNNFFQSPEYIQAVSSISDALLPFPEARRAVAQAMRALGHSHVPALEGPRAVEEPVLIEVLPAA
jgi:hypothetical protein